MVLMTGLDSVIESLYLKEELSSKMRDCNIVVNPTSSFVANKTVVINSKYYPTEYIDELIENRNTVISRINMHDDRIILDPYELRINDNIRPLGNPVSVVNEYLYENIDHHFTNGILYYPKPLAYYDYMSGRNLTVLGYLLYQLGCRMNEVPEYVEFDVIKSRVGIYV